MEVSGGERGTYDWKSRLDSTNPDTRNEFPNHPDVPLLCDGFND